MNLKSLQEKLNNEDLTLVAQIQDTIYTSQLKGIAPLINPMKENQLFFKDAIVVDRVIGKAAAMLLALSQVQYIYAYVLSRKAREILDAYKIDYDYEKLADYIVNRDHTGMCPMEKTVYDMTDLNEALAALIQKQEELSKR
ncbi:MAG: DUF1893 domain-containing protein [Coprobacillus cateniformis]|uniref:DUF1893 domain-containing protein n=1 Tax=Longibaculum muris TaxID=1796628 RepID=UPI00189DE0FF|nr:DUF1893 domain-containing protein [Longibaculum muris]MBS5113045.1 DUF1893 domain-containing protein [Coprobacillus cateniformis]